MRQICINVISLIALCGLCLPLCFADNNLYRYKDKDGHPVMTSNLPAEVAEQGGYDIISPRGNVIESIPPAKTKEELAKEAQDAEKQKQDTLKAEEARKQAALQAKKDDILLKTFSSEKDIARSRDEKVASLQVLVEITNDNISRLQKQLDSANVSKTNYEKSNQNIPDTLQKTINESQRQIQDNKEFLARKLKEIKDIHTEYQDLIDRYHQLNQHAK